MSKKSLLYIIIIICVLTSGFFLASNYRSSIEMKNRGENIIPSVKDVEDIKQPQIELKIDMAPSDQCTDHTTRIYLCTGEYGDYCCSAEDFCTTHQGIYDSGECYSSRGELECITGGGNWTGTECKSQNQINCEAEGKTWFNDYNECAAPNTNDYCRLEHGNNASWVYVQNKGCYDKTTDEYCVAIGKAKYYKGDCRTQAEYNEMTCTDDGRYWTGSNCVSYDSDAYCSATHNGNTNWIYVQNKGCYDKTTDEYCVAIGKAKYYKGDCRTQAEYNEMTCTDDGRYWTGSNCVSYDSDAYCIATQKGDIFVPGSGCLYKNTDPYCIATRGTHSSGGACRSNADECVALEGKDAEYKGSPDEKYAPTKCDSVADKCYREGKVLYGGKCITYQQKCEEVSKGTWKNGTCVTNNNGGNGVSGKTSNKDKNDNPKTDDVIGTDASLSDIVLSSGRLMFDFGTSDYRVEVSSNVESITIEPITTDPDATFVVNGDTKLKPGDNVFTIVVTAEDGTTTRTYNLTIVRTDRILSSNSKASLIEIANHEINFDKNQTEYEVDLDKDESELDIKVTAEDNLSITEVLGNEGLENGDIVTVKVTAEDGSYTVYAIKVNKEVPFNIKDYIPYIIAGVAGLLLIVIGVAILKGRKSNDDEDDLDEDDGKDKMKDNDKDKDDFKMKSKDSK